MPFVTFEGLDGSGKSTVINRLQKKLQEKGEDVLVTREPGGPELSEELRAILLRKEGDTPTPRTELLLYEAARAQHVDKIIKPALDAGRWVLCDRFTASSVAFQSGGRAISKNQVDWLNDFATDNLRPEKQLLFDISYEESLKRREQRCLDTGQEHDRFESEKKEFHESVRKSFLDQAKDCPSDWLVFDATKTPDAVFDEVLKSFEELKWL